MGYYFHDFNLKLNHIFSPKNRLYLSVYLGDDKLITKYKNDIQNITDHSNYHEQWGNFLTALRWNHVFGNKLFGNFTFSYTRYRFFTEMNSQYGEANNIQENRNSFFSGIYDFSLKSDFEYFISPKYKLRFGLLATRHVFKPGTTTFVARMNNQTVIDRTLSDETLHSLETAAYVENIMHLGTHLTANLGLRVTNYSISNKPFTYLEPRLLINYNFSKTQSFKMSFSKMNQNVHLLSNSGMGMPVDFWLPATDLAPPSVSFQYTIGYAATLSKMFELSVEGYYKKMNKLITFKPGASYFGTNESFFQKIETNGTGTVYGIDFLIQKKAGRLTGWLGYSWMKNYRKFQQINNGRAYPYKYDRRNDISLVVNYKLSKNIDLSATWVYGTGQALTLPVAKYYLPVVLPGLGAQQPYLQEIYIYTRKNGFRAKAYHRMDIGINFKKQKKWGQRIWNISIYNLYNRKNPYNYYLSG